MVIVGWILLGLLAAAIAKLLLPGDDPGGFTAIVAIAVAGAAAGSLLASVLDAGELSDLVDPRAAVVGIIFALFLLAVSRRRGRSREPSRE